MYGYGTQVCCDDRPIARGGTVFFFTSFFDVNCALTQPAGAVLNIRYQEIDGTPASVQVPMTPPAPGQVQWTAEWDSRDAWPGAVYCSIHTTGLAIPYAVEDFQFQLEANPANLATF